MVAAGSEDASFPPGLCEDGLASAKPSVNRWGSPEEVGILRMAPWPSLRIF